MNPHRLGITLAVGVIACLASSNSYAIKPSRIYTRTPTALVIKYDSLNIPSSDHKRLTAWLCPAAKKQSDQIIIIAGPDAGNMSYGLDMAQAMTANLGVDVLLFDYRGFGTSDTAEIDTDLIALPEFAEDLHSVATFVKSKFQPDTSKIILYGMSLGASLAITVAENFGGVGGVIAESPYVTQAELVNYYNADYERSGTPRKIRAAESTLLEPMDGIWRLTIPIMIMHGELEKQITSQAICTMFLKCSSTKKTLWIVAGAGHLQIPSVEGGAWLGGIYNFLKAAD